VSSRIAAAALAFVLAAAAMAQSESPDPIAEAGRINARLAMEYLKRGQLQTAQEKIDKALQQNPKDVNVQLSAGLVYERLKNTKQAEKHLPPGGAQRPGQPRGAERARLLLLPQQAAEERRGDVRQAAANPLYRTPFVAYTNAGVCARSAGNLEQAERYLRQALSYQVDYPETFAQLAGVSYDRGSHLQARAFVERFLAVAPATPEMLLLGHDVELALKNDDGAATFKERLQKEFPNSEQARTVDRQAARNPG
jgi:type IV pilus assembly protein PilF